MCYVGWLDFEIKFASDRFEDWFELSEICGFGKFDVLFKFVLKYVLNSYIKESVDVVVLWVDVGEENGWKKDSFALFLCIKRLYSGCVF